MIFSQAELVKIASTMLNSIQDNVPAPELENDGVREMVNAMKRFSLDLSSNDVNALELFQLHFGNRPYNPKLVGVLKQINHLNRKRFMDLKFDTMRSPQREKAVKKPRVERPTPPPYKKWTPEMYMFIVRLLKSMDTYRNVNERIAEEFKREYKQDLPVLLAKQKCSMLRSAALAAHKEETMDAKRYVVSMHLRVKCKFSDSQMEELSELGKIVTLHRKH